MMLKPTHKNHRQTRLAKRTKPIKTVVGPFDPTHATQNVLHIVPTTMLTPLARQRKPNTESNARANDSVLLHTKFYRFNTTATRESDPTESAGSRWRKTRKLLPGLERSRHAQQRSSFFKLSTAKLDSNPHSVADVDIRQYGGHRPGRGKPGSAEREEDGMG